MSRCKFIAVLVCTGLLLILSTQAFCEGTIRIVRPLDNSTIRETVAILVPASSVPDNGFVVYSIDGRFRAGQSTKTANGAYYVYMWDTKALDPDQDIPLSERKPRDGRHTITVQSCDAGGARAAATQTITVYVKNHLSVSDIPASGIRLRYSQKAKSANNYKFDCHVDLESMQGIDGNLIQIVGNSIEGVSGTIKRTTEYTVDADNSFVSQELVGKLRRYSGGKISVDGAVVGRRTYQNEDSRGVFTRINTSGSGQPMTIQLPVLPVQKVRIGDAWRQPTKVLWDPVTDKVVTVSGRSTFEGLEWQMGHPCAKIRTTFSGSVAVPFSKLFPSPVQLTGENITYFAYKVGKVILSETTARGSTKGDRNAVIDAIRESLPSGSTLTAGLQALSQPQTRSQFSSGLPGYAGGPAGMAMRRGLGGQGPGGMMGTPPGFVGGPPGMELGGPGMGMGIGGPGMGAPAVNTGSQADADFTVVASLQLLQ